MISTVVLSTAIEPEAFGRISIEGQAMGKIVVASNIGGSLDTIQDGVTGKLFESGNVQSLADALDWALSLSKEKAKKMINPLYGKKGMGLVNDPKKAIYNKVYNKTTIDGVKPIRDKVDETLKGK